ncbi:MAG TPA: TIGR03862 family flavoprotein [Gammaproteobacteria bacterium]|nr:TIGR03862 family flavoprotein [Gammaproteobacteria bacterium]
MNDVANVTTPTAIVVGGGPAGLMAAEGLSGAGIAVDLYDAMPSVGRKLLLAGIGGLNLTHSEAPESFLARYGVSAAWVRSWLDAFGPVALRTWAQSLGVETFVGSSGRVFPRELKAAPLLRAWLRRLRQAGVRFHLRHRWQGWQGDELLFETPAGRRTVRADVTLLALGGGSWPRLGSDAAWVPWLQARGIPVNALKPANCGFEVGWSDYFRSHYAGEAVKRVSAWLDGGAPQTGEFIVTRHGVEGGLIYTLSHELRERIESRGSAVLHLDLNPAKDMARLAADLSKSRGSQSLANHLRKQAGVDGVKAGLLREVFSADALAEPARAARAIKDLTIKLVAPRPLEEAISSAGGVVSTALDEHLMLKAMPGVFCAGEMLDWEAPTGGYLLTACFASGYVAGQGAIQWLRNRA